MTPTITIQGDRLIFDLHAQLVEVGFTPAQCTRKLAFIEDCRIVRDDNPKVQRHRVLLTAFGEVKSIHEWSLDPRCSIDSYLILTRVRDSGFAAERAITQPRHKRPALKHGRSTL